MIPIQFMDGTLDQKSITIDATPAITLILGGKIQHINSFLSGIYENIQLQFKRYGHP